MPCSCITMGFAWLPLLGSRIQGSEWLPVVPLPAKKDRQGRLPGATSCCASGRADALALSPMAAGETARAACTARELGQTPQWLPVVIVQARDVDAAGQAQTVPKSDTGAACAASPAPPAML